MTRQKKTRKAGPLAQPKTPRDNRATDAASKGKKVGKGQAPGQRHSSAKVLQPNKTKGDEKDPRHGSRRKVSLVMTPEQELKQLQEDTKLQLLIERFESDEPLTVEEQRYLDEKSERYEQLVEKLGYELDEEWDDEES
ncbi:GTPase-activating protein [Idiomarina sp. HP20-50]|uniref:GTPase-activating protein n=1 Tax=Idiomarina sp. HP20-50 TaxID=3070813 RepID=UPI00294B23DD|nr:GTPase-activating protein [Idiomarina sp. HP20-50]MDV6316480.1 GTPase-activating protein [Idiomarina sp. HP20-50]